MPSFAHGQRGQARAVSLYPEQPEIVVGAEKIRIHSGGFRPDPIGTSTRHHFAGFVADHLNHGVVGSDSFAHVHSQAVAKAGSGVSRSEEDHAVFHKHEGLKNPDENSR